MRAKMIKEMTVQTADILRYGLWLAVAATAEANRREYHMSTTWLPHLLTNSLSLFLPELYRSISLNGKSAILPHDLSEPLNRLLKDNPRYAGYVMPLALGYILSH